MTGKYICSTCGERIEEEIADVQEELLDMTEGSSCRDCLEDVKTNPQMESLLEQVEEALNPENTALWKEKDLEDQVVFAMHCINEGHVEGGSPGFIEELRKYAALLKYETKEEKLEDR